MFEGIFTGSVMILLGICIMLLLYFGRRTWRVNGLLTVEGTVTELHKDGCFTVEYIAENHIYTKKYSIGINPQMFADNRFEIGQPVQVTVRRDAPGRMLSVRHVQGKGSSAEGAQRGNTKKLIWLAVLCVVVGIYQILSGLGFLP